MTSKNGETIAKIARFLFFFLTASLVLSRLATSLELSIDAHGAILGADKFVLSGRGWDREAEWCSVGVGLSQNDRGSVFYASCRAVVSERAVLGYVLEGGIKIGPMADVRFRHFQWVPGDDLGKSTDALGVDISIPVWRICE